MSDIIERVINAAFLDHEDPATATATVAAPPELTPFMDALKVPPMLRPAGDGETRHVEIELKASWVRMHSQLPPTLVWAYDGHFPGPTIEVRRGQRIRVAWKNRLTGPYPVTSVAVPQGRADDPNTNRPGRDGVKPDEDVAALPAWTVTHLHGAVTGGGNDGWAENAVGAGDAQLSEYPNDHRATQWWYHDHALNITRWNVYAGLVGSYLVRDDAEDALGLPSGDQELPLILSDRNFDTDEEGRLDGRLLHKVINLGPDEESGKDVTLPFDGPYTTVNGTVWPYLDAEPRWYRFRLLNASNARTYRLALVDEEGRPVPDGTVKQIGSDGGLLPHPVDIRFSEKPDDPEYPDDPGVLPVAPAERLDLLVDLRALRGRRLRLVDTGTTGFGNPDPAQKVPFPQVMEFRVGADPVADSFVLPGTLAPAFRRLTHEIPHGHRLIVLTAPGTKGGGGHPEIWEMEEAEEDGGVVGPSDGILQIRGSDKVPRTFRRISRTFDDVLGIRVPEGDHEQWSFLNLGAPMHPMHIHMTDFQILGRELFDISGFAPEAGGTRAPLEFLPGEPLTVAPNERGWKEVFRVPQAQMVNVMGRFSGAYGRFMYHCHLLEHEDAGMMRPFIAVPPEAMRFDHGGEGGGHGGH